MGSYGGAEICELIGLFILKHLGKTFGNKNIGLYRDDGLTMIKNKSARLANKTRKELQSGCKFACGKLPGCYFRPHIWKR